MNTPYFAIDQLTDQLGKFSLGPVSLTLEKNEYFVLLGPTGCGKSSLLRQIAGIRGAKNETIYLDGADIGALAPRKRTVGFVTQTCDLFPHLTVRENIGFGLAYVKLDDKEKNKRIDRFLSLFNLNHQANQLVTTLSGGESKRTAMARSLITQPRLLLLDEPLGMLDHNGRKSILQILKMIHNELMITTIHVTHDRHEAWQVGQTCAVMDQGKILQYGPVIDLFRTPDSLFVAEFLGGANIFQAAFDGVHARLPWGNVTLSKPIRPDMTSGWVLIRPELIRIVSDKKQEKLGGHITAIHDMGEYLEVTVKTAVATDLLFYSSLNTTFDASVGSNVSLDWPDDAIHPIYKGRDSHGNHIQNNIRFIH